MEASLRKSMTGLHTWAGVILGSVLFAIFWMGTLSVFDKEIDRWMMPATRVAQAQAPVSLDTHVKPVAERLSGNASQWFITLPDERAPAYRVGYQDAAGKFQSRSVDPHTGALLAEAGTHGGTGFIFPFHYRLHIGWKNLGYWLVGLAAMGMLVMLVSGVIIHRKIFREFFTFRPKKQLPRASLDLHNLSGVLMLPFHFLITLSGLIIFYAIYFPWPTALPFGGDKEALRIEKLGFYSRPKADRPAPLASLDAMVQDAQARWRAHHGTPVMADFVRVSHPGDAASFVYVRSVFPRNSVQMDRGMIVYDGSTGKVIKEHYSRPVRGVHAFIAGMHFIQFKHWTLRWLYFLAGLSGCAMIATGFLFWIEARRTRHAREGRSGVALVQGLAVGSVTGMVMSTLAFFVINRVLPADAAIGSLERAGLEMLGFYVVWVLSFVHGWKRQAQAWREQAWVIAALALAAVALNWITTRHHVPGALNAGLTAVALMDVVLVATAGIAVVAARRMGRKARAAAVSQPTGAGVGASKAGAR